MTSIHLGDLLAAMPGAVQIPQLGSPLHDRDQSLQYAPDAVDTSFGFRNLAGKQFKVFEGCLRNVAQVGILGWVWLATLANNDAPNVLDDLLCCSDGQPRIC